MKVIHVEKIITSNKNPVYNISNQNQIDELVAIFRALSTHDRIKILNLIQNKPMTIKELSQCMDLPISSITQHTNVLSEANLIYIEYKPNKKGVIKLCSKSINTMKVIFDDLIDSTQHEETIYEMPIGNFSDVNVIPPCGMAGLTSQIGDYDDLSSFYHPNRHKAELLWFSNGSISYRFPNSIKDQNNVENIMFSLEICSETLYSRNDWPSDITFWINGNELLTWTSPGDFGGRRGKYTPDYWFINSTQYGLLKNIKIDKKGVFLDDVLVNSNFSINDIDFSKENFIELKIGIKPGALHKGGINIFGKNFGDHKQAIIMRIIRTKQ